MSHLVKRLFVVLFVALLAAGFILVGVSGLVHVAHGRNIYSTGNGMPPDEEPRVVLIFGLERPPDESTQPALTDRISTTLDLLRTSRASKILITGTPEETRVLNQSAQQLNLPAARIVVDDGSASAYDSCYRAREMYGVNRAILVAQGFQLDRLLYVCNKLGVDSIGLVADRQAYDSWTHMGWLLGDMFYLVRDLLDINVLKPVPTLGALTPFGN
jgi:vancomycin permeability regulator SanA